LPWLVGEPHAHALDDVEARRHGGQQGVRQPTSHALVKHGGTRGHDETPIDDLVAAAVVRQLVEVGDGPPVHRGIHPPSVGHRRRGPHRPAEAHRPRRREHLHPSHRPSARRRRDSPGTPGGRPRCARLSPLFGRCQPARSRKSRRRRQQARASRNDMVRACRPQLTASRPGPPARRHADP
jgi:hypothetical protein